MDNKQLITSDITKKEKAVIAQRNYRQRIRAGTSETSNVTYETYKKQNSEYMRKYRLDRKIKTTKAYAESINEPPKITAKKITKVRESTEVRRSGRDKKQVDMTIKKTNTIVKPVIVKQTVPKWKKKLPDNATEAQKIEARKFDDEPRKEMLKKVINVMEAVLLLKPSKDIIRVIKSIFSGHEIKGDLKFIRKEMPFLTDKANNVINFVNKVHQYYPNDSSFNGNMIPFVNIVSRIPSYNSTYQQLTNLTSETSIEINEERDGNTISKEDEGKIFSFDPDDVKYHIDKFLKTDVDKAIAACYALMPPRRLDFQYMVLTENNDVSMLTDRKYNYLVMNGGEPTLFVYNNYKTFSTYRQQVIPVELDVAKYLRKYIESESSNLLPILGLQGKYLFGSSYNTVHNKLFGTKLSNIFYKMYGENITSRWIRSSAATWIHSVDKRGMRRPLSEKKDFAWKMGHSQQLSQQYDKIIIVDEDGKEEAINTSKKGKTKK